MSNRYRFNSSCYLDILFVSHANLMQDPAEEISKIDEFLGGNLDREAMATVIDPSLHREKAKQTT